MTEPAPRLHLVDTETGETTSQCAQCLTLLRQLDRQEDIIARKQREIDELRHAKKDLLATTDLAGDIMDVLKLHKRLLSPSATIHRCGPAWKAIKDRLEDTDAVTGRPAFTKRHLQGAIVGLWVTDAEDGWYRAHGKIGAAWLFANPDRVQQFLAPVIGFHRDHGTSALAVVDQLGTPALSWLADRCSCGQLRATHLMGWTDCEFDEFNAKVERFKAQQPYEPVLTPSGREWAGG